MRWIKYVVAAFLLSLIAADCTPSKLRLVTSDDIIYRDEDVSLARRLRSNDSYKDYIPDPTRPELLPPRILRVNVHFMNADNGTQNYKEDKAPDFARELIHGANVNLRKNRKMRLPQGNDTPVLPPLYQLELTSSEGYERQEGVYCHYDDDLYYFISKGRNRNNYSRDVISTYSVGLDSIINIFIMPHHPDSVRSKSYSVTSAGIALGSAIKLSGIYETGKKAYSFRGLTNHEIGHVLGLRHTWSGNDGCEDTPNHPNCWNLSKDPPCDTQSSNNLMDYNASQHAWTPCQIGKIHQNFAKEGSKSRRLIVQDWCRKRDGYLVEIFGDEVWHGAKDLMGDLVIHPGAKLHVRNRLSLPAGGRIIVAENAELIVDAIKLHNACGYRWDGILTQGSGASSGRVTFVGEPIIENTPAKFTESVQR